MTKWKYFNEAEFVYNGTQEDPTLIYKGNEYNYYDIEDPIYEQFKEYAAEHGIVNIEPNLEEYCKSNQDLIRELFGN